MLTSVRRTGVASLALTAFLTTVGATGLASPALAHEAPTPRPRHGLRPDRRPGRQHGRRLRPRRGRQTHAGRDLCDRWPRRCPRRLGRRPPRVAGLARPRPRASHPVRRERRQRHRHRLRVSAAIGSPAARSFPRAVRSRSASPFTGTSSTSSTLATAAASRASVAAADGLRPIAGSHRALGLDASATPEFVNTPGQVAFSPDGSQLLVTTKANGNQVDAFTRRTLGCPERLTNGEQPPGRGPVRHQLGPVRSGRPGRGRHELGGNVPARSRRCPPRRSPPQRPGRPRPAGSSAAVAGSTPPTPAARRCRGTAWAVAASSASLGTTATDPGTVDATVTRDGRYLYVQAGLAGQVDAFRIGRDGSLTSARVRHRAGRRGRRGHRRRVTHLRVRPAGPARSCVTGGLDHAPKGTGATTGAPRRSLVRCTARAAPTSAGPGAPSGPSIGRGGGIRTRG